MKNVLPNSVQEILASYEQKRLAKGLKFTPPDEKAQLGKYAFSDDIITQILVGLISGVLVEVAKAAFAWGKERFKKEQKLPKAAVKEAVVTSSAAREGVKLLTEQGIRGSEAEQAVHLLAESISESLE